ncbi:MAG: FAD-binding oxidoreductase [Alphaproteobacteria bacterium]|nr:FAD-binding oxidoreductase [Alphaproteobacteria bacterium]
MRKICIVGAGYAGLLLGHGLLARGYDVTIVTDRTADEVRSGRIMSNQCLWGDSLALERELGLELWGAACPPIPGFDTHVLAPDGTVLHRFLAPLTSPGQSLDQRLKFAAWTELFAARGGRLSIMQVGADEIEALAASYDLVICAAGKGRGEMKRFFEIDPARTRYDAPQRFGASIHVRGRRPGDGRDADYETWAVIPGVGEFWIFPTLTVHGPGHVICLEGVPGGPLDVWHDVKGPEAHRRGVLALLEQWLPAESARCRDVALVDDKAFLSGGVAGAVARPVRVLASGRAVLAVGDAFVLNDPISQQGANSAARAARLYIERIVARADRPFDRAWMEETAARFWDYARWAVRLTELYLQPSDRFLDVFRLSARSPRMARMLADSNNDVAPFVAYLDAPERSGRRSFSPWSDVARSAAA